jgi:RNA polymerase sigma factor (sigma-70 family)
MGTRELQQAEAPSTPDRSAARDELAVLARAAAAGRTDAVHTLIVSMTPAVLKTVRGVLGRRHPDVDDTAQDAIWRFVNALPGFRYECSVLHFACKVALHTALNARRREHVRGAGKHDALGDDLVASERSPAQELAAAARREAVRDLLDALPTAQAEVLALHLILGLSLEESAAVCGVPVNTVRSRIRLAKQAIRMRTAASPALREALEPIE